MDLLFEEVNVGPSRKSWEEFVEDWQAGMKKAYEIASEVSRKVARRNIAQYDQRAGAASLSETCKKGGPGKLRAQWELTDYWVKERRGILNHTAEHLGILHT